MTLRANPERWLAALAAVAFLGPPGGSGQPLEPLLGLDAFMDAPPENPLTAEKAELGKRLFFDKRLSLDGSLACAGCHDPARAFADSRAVAVGVFGREGSRRVPKLLNRGYGRSFFWDGGASTLEEQVFKPILNPAEMALTEREAVGRVRRDAAFAEDFARIFGAVADRRTIAFALASYVRTIRSGDAPYDRYLAGYTAALDGRQKRGLRLFRTKANCVACHLGPNFTDEDFHNTGVGWESGAAADPGRQQVTGRIGDTGSFKTPTLREAAWTPPYMHNGSLATLREVIDFYDEGGVRNPYLDPEIVPLRLTAAEKTDLAAFLESLNGRVVDGPDRPPATR